MQDDRFVLSAPFVRDRELEASQDKPTLTSLNACRVLTVKGHAFCECKVQLSHLFGLFEGCAMLQVYMSA